MKKNVSPLFAALLFFSVAPFFAAAQTGGERIESGRFGAEEPETGAAGSVPGTYKDRWLFLGPRLGPSLGIYTAHDDTAFTGGDTYGASLDAGLQMSLQIVPLFSFQAELIFTWDNASVWFYTLNAARNDLDSHTRQFTGFSFHVPLTAKMNFYPGKFRISPFLGCYFPVALGTMTVNDALGGKRAFSYAFSPPLGILGGLSAAFPLGPGMIFADIRYAADLAEPELRDGGDVNTYRRHRLVVSAGYEFGFFEKQRTGRAR
jgi:hypothetical protein